MIVMDTVRYDHLTMWGGNDTTPSLERLCEESIAYNCAFASSPWTTPSHASIFSGLYPWEHNINMFEDHLGSRFCLISEMLSEAGYATLGITNNPWISSSFGFERGFQKFIEVFRKSRPKLLCEKIKKSLFVVDDGADHTNKQIKRFVRRQSKKQPFFVFVNYMEAHQPYYPKRPFHKKYIMDKVWRCVLKNHKYLSSREDIFLGRKELVPEDIEIIQKLYDSEISYLDSKIGELLDYLRQGDIFDQTVVIVASDHGETFGERGIGEGRLVGHHFSLCNNLIKIPLIIKPAGKNSAKQIDTPVSLTCLHGAIKETLLTNEFPELQDVKTNRKNVMASYITPPSFLKRTFKTLSADNELLGPFKKNLRAIFSENGQFKMVKDIDTNDIQLYDLHKDVGETQNLVSQEKYQQILDELKYKLEDDVEQKKEGECDVVKGKADKLIKKQLKDLGYL